MKFLNIITIVVTLAFAPFSANAQISEQEAGRIWEDSINRAADTYCSYRGDGLSHQRATEMGVATFVSTMSSRTGGSQEDVLSELEKEEFRDLFALHFLTMRVNKCGEYF